MAPTRSRSTSPSGTRRRSTVSGDGTVAQLTTSVNELIRQNNYLKKQLARFEGGSGGWTAAPQRQLVRLQRKVAGAMIGTTTAPSRTRSTRAISTAPVTTTRRKVTDPEILEKRRASLAKARAVRSQKAAQNRSR